MVIGIMVGIVISIATLIWLGGWFIICQAMFSNLFNEENDENQIEGEENSENDPGESLGVLDSSEQSSSEYEWDYRWNYQ